MQINVEPPDATRGRRIFIVEGDEVVRSALKFMLRARYEVHALTSLAQAYAKGSAWKPDLVLLGLAIVQERGLEAIGELAARLPGVRILLVADTIDDPFTQACRAVGAHGVLGKPISINSVRRHVEAVLGKHEAWVASPTARTPVFKR